MQLYEERQAVSYTHLDVYKRQAIIFFIATFALGFYAYYWWNYKLEFDPAYDTMEEFAERYMKGEMIAFVNMPQIEQEILSQYQEFLNDYQTNGINIKDIGDMLYVCLLYTSN